MSGCSDIDEDERAEIAERTIVLLDDTAESAVLQRSDRHYWAEDYVEVIGETTSRTVNHRLSHRLSTGITCANLANVGGELLTISGSDRLSNTDRSVGELATGLVDEHRFSFVNLSPLPDDRESVKCGDHMSNGGHMTPTGGQRLSLSPGDNSIVWDDSPAPPAMLLSSPDRSSFCVETKPSDQSSNGSVNRLVVCEILGQTSVVVGRNVSDSMNGFDSTVHETLLPSLSQWDKDFGDSAFASWTPVANRLSHQINGNTSAVNAIPAADDGLFKADEVMDMEEIDRRQMKLNGDEIAGRSSNAIYFMDLEPLGEDGHEDYVPYFNDDDGVVEFLAETPKPLLPLSLERNKAVRSMAGDRGGKLIDEKVGQRPAKATIPVTIAELFKMGGRVNIADLLTPVRPTRKTTKAIAVQDEFFGVYCLISRSENRAYKNRCYIGYTVNPNRRIRQHNAGRQFGGAKKTDSRGPWDMVCIIHGFPNSISALRFEWAWQNPAKSRRLREFESLQRKARTHTPFEHQLRIACRMMNTDPWRRLALTFRWLLPECAIPFAADLPPPPHVQMAAGVVTKTETVVPDQVSDYCPLSECRLCGQSIDRLKRLLRCLNAETCGAHYHARCLAENELIVQDELSAQLTPLSAHCPVCARVFLWGDLVRDQRMLCAVEAAKPSADGREGGRRIAEGMIPRQITKL